MISNTLLTPFRKFINKRFLSTCVSSEFVLNNVPMTQCSLLKNGLIVATEERKSCNTNVGIFINAGARFENDCENGITHLFEHIAFKGSVSKSKTEIEDLITSTGAKFQCLTSRDMINFNAECITEDFSTVVTLLLECVFNNLYSESEIEIQKQIIYQEMLEHDNNSHGLLFDYLHATAFQGTRLAQTVMGLNTNLSKFKACNVSTYINKLFQPNRTVLVTVGDVKHEQMVDLGNLFFCNYEVPLTPITLGPSRYTGSDVRYRNDNIRVTHAAIAVEGPCFCSEDRLILELVTILIGGWDRYQPKGLDNSPYLARVASDGLSDAYKAFNIFYQDTGLWGIHFISPVMCTEAMAYNIQKELMKICLMITDNELIRAKHEMKTEILLKNVSASETCKEIGEWVMYTGGRPSLPDRFKAIDGISAKRVKDVCDKYIYDRCPVVVGMGAVESLPDYTRIRAGMYWARL